MNEQIEAIRNEIKRLQEGHERNLDKPMERGRIGYSHGVVACCGKILYFIDSLPEETAPKGYDESYLNECIAKASKTWEGVDVAKYMDEVRGNCPKLSDNLEEAAEKYEEEHTYQRYDGGGFTPEYNATLAEAFITGATWQKEQMMKDAVEGEYDSYPAAIYLETPVQGIEHGDKVRVIIVKEDKK